jgi:hypothetical protein
VALAALAAAGAVPTLGDLEQDLALVQQMSHGELRDLCVEQFGDRDIEQLRGWNTPRMRQELTAQVRKPPSRPRSWANCSLLQLYSHRNARANLHLLRQPDTFLAAAPRGDAERLPECPGLRQRAGAEAEPQEGKIHRVGPKFAS